MAQNAKAAVMASFIADSLALGAHWEYDTAKLAETHGLVNNLIAPVLGSYHQTKSAGDLTHYGDQALVLMDSLVAMKGFDLADFAQRWQELFENGYRGYMDGATKGALANFASGADPESSGSTSNDLAGAARIAPLLWQYSDDLSALIPAARQQAQMTHNHPDVVAASEFFARTAHSVLMGMSPVRAIQESAGHRYNKSPLNKWVEMGLARKKSNTIDAIAELGQSCHINEAFPAVIHLIARHEDDLERCLIANVMAGGDSAARGMLAGLVVGGALGMEGVPVRWQEALNISPRLHEILVPKW